MPPNIAVSRLLKIMGEAAGQLAERLHRLGLQQFCFSILSTFGLGQQRLQARLVNGVVDQQRQLTEAGKGGDPTLSVDDGAAGIEAPLAACYCRY